MLLQNVKALHDPSDSKLILSAAELQHIVAIQGVNFMDVILVMSAFMS